MTEKYKGTVLSCIGGLFSVLCDNGKKISCRARGSFRRSLGAIVSGDAVYCTREADGYVISDVLPRKNLFIRPPLSNLSVLFITFSPRDPECDTVFIDKLFSIAVFNKVTPAAVITKSDLDPEKSLSLASIYKSIGFDVFITSSVDATGIDSLRTYISSAQSGNIFAFCGMSGVGKSSLVNTVYPDLKLKTDALSEKIARGKNTTRVTTLYPLPNGSFTADSPGFSMLDFVSFDFMSLGDLAGTFPDFAPYASDCRYRDCSHAGEEECAVLAAANSSRISPSRYASYLAIREELKHKPKIY